MARLAPLVALLVAVLCAAPALARPGDVDTTFGDGGQAIVPGDTGTSARGLTRLADGRLLLARSEFAPGGGVQLAVIAFTPDGRLDRTFGDRGVARPPLGFTDSGPLVTDAGIVLVGSAAGERRAAAVRLRPDGSLDSSFGQGGLAVVPGGGQTEAAGGFVQADGRVVIVGLLANPAERFSQPGAVRLLPDGSVDPSFGGQDGWARISVPGAHGLVYEGFERPDGRLVIAGEFASGGELSNEYAATLVGLERDGSPDDSYGDNGVARGFFTGQGGTFGGITVQPDGKVVLAGGTLETTPSSFAIARANPDGGVDTGFGSGGRVFVRPPGSDPASPVATSAEATVVQSDGKLVVAGTGAPTTDGRILGTWAVVRLQPDGTLDPGFGAGGWSVMPAGPTGRLWPSGLVRTLDGRVVIGGDAADCGQGASALIRLHAENPGAETDAGPVMRTCDATVETEPDGDLPLAVQCPHAEDVCRGTATITIPASRPVRVGARSFRLRGAETGTLTIRPSRAARRYIRRPAGVRAQVTYSTRDGDGNRRVHRRKLRLMRPARP